MSRDRILRVMGSLPVLLLLIGLLVFIMGIGLQYLLTREIGTSLVGPDVRPFVPIAMVGLCIIALVLVAWFIGVGVLLARQTRLHGADYGDAYQLMETFQFKDAIPLLERSISNGKETVEVLTLLARAYAYSGQYSRAHRAIDRAAELYPEDAAPYVTLGLVFLLEGSDDQAITALQAAVACDPTPVNWADLGLALALASRKPEALTALEKASQQPLPTPHALRVYYRLMNLYTSAGDALKAAGAAAKMVSARDGLPVWEYQLDAIKGTAYGQRLAREIQAIADALSTADAAQVAI